MKGLLILAPLNFSYVKKVNILRMEERYSVMNVLRTEFAVEDIYQYIHKDM